MLEKASEAADCMTKILRFFPTVLLTTFEDRSSLVIPKDGPQQKLVAVRKKWSWIKVS